MRGINRLGFVMCKLSLTQSLTDLGGVEEAVVVADPSLQLDKDQASDL